MSVWDDPAKESVRLQERNEASEYDTAPGINALEPMPPEPKPSGVLLRRTSDEYVIHRSQEEAAALVASGEYRPVLPGDTWTENGTLTCGADDEWVQHGRKERLEALTRLQAAQQEQVKAETDLETLAARVRGMSDEEIQALEQSLIQPLVGVGSGLVRGPERSS